MTTLTLDAMQTLHGAVRQNPRRGTQLWVAGGNFLRVRLYWAPRHGRRGLHVHARYVSLRLRVVTARNGHHDSPQPCGSDPCKSLRYIKCPRRMGG